MQRNRAIAAGVGLLVVLGALIWLGWAGPAKAGFLPKCVFHQVTGWHCPGCGMTRAIHAVLHGDWAAAFRFNPPGLLALGACLGWMAWRFPAWLRGEPVKWPLGTRGAVWLLAGIVVFGLLRNLPFWPFSLLAPP